MGDKLQAVIIGEVLFDLFEDGQAVLGGAPLNVAWHLQGFGLSPLLISRVGEDRYGEQITETMQKWGMDLSGLQIDPAHSTGLVKVKLDKGQAAFEICDAAAYDYINLAQTDLALTKISSPFLYYGSLAARHHQVYDTIQQLRQAASQSFVDINLRPPWWDMQKLTRLMQGVNYLKVNDDELCRLTGVSDDLSAMADATKDLIQQYQIDTVIVTRGDQGALVVTADNIIQSPPVRVHNMQDTVGAGDAFSAVSMLGVMQEWEPALIFARATEFAARICEQRGATNFDLAMYDNFRTQWQLT